MQIQRGYQASSVSELERLEVWENTQEERNYA